MKASNILLKISNEIYDKKILAVIKRLKNQKIYNICQRV